VKYSRTFHLPWSPGKTRDDRVLDNLGGLLGLEIVITEKLDGSNVAYSRESVFARSHSGPPAHPSFDVAKATHAQIRHLIPERVTVFVEYCRAVHSIEYDGLPGYSHAIGVREDNDWWDWDATCDLATNLGLPTVPLLHRGVLKDKRDLELLTGLLGNAPSIYGGTREGVVVRREAGCGLFDGGIAKWVRADHVQTDEHWTHQKFKPQKLK
jgi:RNA ligase-like protein